MFDEWFELFSRPDAPGASALVIKRGKVLYAKGYGLADVEEQTPCAINTNFRLASVSKQFTAMAALILVDRGRLTLDERLTRFIPQFPPHGQKITVWHLLNHTSGVLDYEPLIPKGTVLPVLDRDVLRLLMRQSRTYYPPGSRYRYSNSGYALLAQIIEARSGMRLAEFLRRNIFKPLKMNHTVAYEEGISSVPYRAYGYSAKGRGFVRTDQSLTSSVLGDGGIYSSVADLFKWDQALYTDQLVSPRLLRQSFEPGVPTNRSGTAYGFGWYVSQHRGEKEVWHHGETIGFTTFIVRYPQKKLSVIILTNRTGAKIGQLARKIANACW